MDSKDWHYLMKRTVDNSTQFKNAVRLMATNDECKQYNEKCLKALKKPIARIIAEGPKTAAKISTNDFGGLPPVLSIAVGARVMLTRNLCINKGLINGAFGTVKAIFYEKDNKPPNLPIAVIVQFDKFTGKSILADKSKWVAIKPESTSIMKERKQMHRQQLPLKLAWGITIHKSQGLTLDKIVVHLNEQCPKSKGLEFVALSRVRKISDLMITPISLERFKKINLPDSKRKAEERRLRQIHSDTIEKYKNLKNIDINEYTKDHNNSIEHIQNLNLSGQLDIDDDSYSYQDDDDDEDDDIIMNQFNVQQFTSHAPLIIHDSEDSNESEEEEIICRGPQLGHNVK